jgi:hypothetical protein
MTRSTRQVRASPVLGQLDPQSSCLFGHQRRQGRAAVKARAAAERRLAGALNRLLDAGLSIREASERIGIGYHRARQLLRTGPMPDPEAKADS